MRDELLELLSNEFPEIDFEESNTMVDDGILDSLTITGIIAAITMEYGIEIPFEEISEDNFNSIDALADLVERLS